MTTRTLFALGFRPFYLLAGLFAVGAVLLWLLSFTGRFQFGHYLQATLWHGHEMVFGFLAAVIAGFQLTAVRNWTGRPTPTGAALAAIAALWIAARALLITGPVPFAVAVDLLFLPVLAVAVAIPIVASRNQRNYKVVGMLAALAMLHLVYHLAMHGHLPAAAIRGSLLASIDVIVILFALIGGRVIPAFTRNAVNGSDPRHLIWVEVVAFGALLLLALLSLLHGSMAFSPLLPAVLAAIAAFAHALRLALWQPWLTVTNPLLWMLPVAYSWLPVALVLRALAGFGFVMSGTWVHALTAGALTSMIIAMMVRSSLGHTGRPLVASGTDMLIFLLIQLAAVLRVFAGVSADGYRMLVIASGVVWALAFAIFLTRYLPLLTQPRVDGKPG